MHQEITAPRRILFLGGNGHSTARLLPARQACARLLNLGEIGPLELTDVRYPGFEGRPCESDLESFLQEINTQIITGPGSGGNQTLIHGTGIGGLLALCLRAGGNCLEIPLLLQAPVLWGLEHRLMPRLMRWRGVQPALQILFSLPLFQSWFVRRQFESRVPPELQKQFFAGYRSCVAATQLFTWLNPRLLRDLEEGFRRHPERLQQISVWWGGRDRVVSPQEVAWTQKALGVEWPVRLFPGWGHYPMIDDPTGWIKALDEVFNG